MLCFRQYIAGYTVANLCRYPIRRRIAFASALELLFIFQLFALRKTHSLFGAKG